MPVFFQSHFTYSDLVVAMKRTDSDDANAPELGGVDPASSVIVNVNVKNDAPIGELVSLPLSPCLSAHPCSARSSANLSLRSHYRAPV